MSGHTPGPWSIKTVPTSAGSCHMIGPFPGSAPHRREVHACVYADGVRIGLDESNPAAQQLLANARLIAAAPLLLAVAECEEALSMRVDEGRDVLERHGWVAADRFDLPATEFVARLRRAAIAAATEETA